MKALSNNSAETQRLLELIRVGESEALNQLFARYRTYLHQVIEMRLDGQIRKRVDTSDLIQEIQLEATRRLADYLERETVPFRFWLRQIARNRLQKARQQHVDTVRRTVTREMPLPERSSLQLAMQLVSGGSSPSIDQMIFRQNSP